MKKVPSIASNIGAILKNIFLSPFHAIKFIGYDLPKAVRKGTSKALLQQKASMLKENFNKIKRWASKHPFLAAISFAGMVGFSIACAGYGWAILPFVEANSSISALGFLGSFFCRNICGCGDQTQSR